MNSKDLFALSLRIVGVLGITYVIRNCVRVTSTDAFYLVLRLVYVIIGLYLIRGAPMLVKFAYPEKGGEATTPKK